ncbi:MAG: glycoside hydrolase family 9 protein [Ruminococcus sp.]|jgi:hypothetical protein|nr:glycoside hydrolase family 9 protein [Ruminococcus sp.]
MTSRIQINQIGYYDRGAKHAFLLAETDRFNVVDRVNDEIVFSGFPERAIFIDAWGMKIVPLDFSELSLTGSFYIICELPTGQILRSDNFEISKTPFLSFMNAFLEALPPSRKYYREKDYSEIAFSTACLIFHILVSRFHGVEAAIYDITESINTEIKHNLLMTLTRDDFKPSELASVSAAAALGSWFFRKTEKSLSDRLSKVAVKTWIENIEISRASGTQNSPGTLFWGLCALYAITGSEDFLLAAKENIPRDPTSFTVSNPSGFGMISAFLLPGGGDLALRRSLREALRVKADNLTSNTDRFFVTRDDFSRNSNELLLSDTLALFSANTILREPSYKAAAARNISYICGVNPLEKCFVTGFGKNPVKYPHLPSDLTRGDDGLRVYEAPLPGIVVPGANSDIKTDGYLTWQMTGKTPPAKCYGDTKTSPTTNSASLSMGALMFFAAGIS